MIDESLINKAEREIESQISTPGGSSTTSELLKLIEGSGIELFLDEHSEPHATLRQKPLVAFPISSAIFKRHLRKLYWERYEKGCSSEAMNQTIGALEGRADSENKVRRLFNRIARVDSKIYYDLGDNEHTIEIDEAGWRLATSCPVRFRRFKHQLVQAMPVSGGEWRQVLRYVNLCDPQNQLLFLTYIPTAFIPDIPRVILVCAGDQGAAKSTAMRVARSLIDPSSAELLSPPRDSVELGQAANHNYCLYLDNLSPLSEELSDTLCRLVTGIGFAKRKLYSDDEDILFNQRSAIGLTGVSVVAQKPDVVDRCLILNFERISDNNRLEEESFWAQFNAEKPLLLGALFDVISGTLGLVSEIVLAQKPRMADYARYAAAAAVILGQTTDSFLAAFGENTKRQNNAAIESSSTAQVVLEFMKGRNEWEGASSELYSLLKNIAEKANLQMGSDGGFPKAANWLGRKIREVRPNLSSLGIEATFGEVSTNSVIYLRKNAATVATAAIPGSDISEVKSGSMATMAVFQDPLNVDDLFEKAKEIFGVTE